MHADAPAPHTHEQADLVLSPENIPIVGTRGSAIFSTPDDAESGLRSTPAPPSPTPHTPAEAFYREYYPQLRALSWRFEITMTTCLRRRDELGLRRIVSSMKTRIKTPASMMAKLESRGLEPTAENAVFRMHDAVGARIICPLLDDLKEVADIIRAMPEFTVVEEKDYVSNPKPNGYRSYHMILCRTEDAAVQPSPELGLAAAIDMLAEAHANETSEHAIERTDMAAAQGRVCLEVQLRTIAMDSWASVEHELKYKKSSPDQEYLVAELKRCADDMAATDLSLQIIADQIAHADEA